MEEEITKSCISTDDIYDIVSGEASDELCSVFAEHVKTCEKCRKEYENIKKIQEALSSCSSEPSADFAKRTMERLKTVNRNPIIRITGTRTFKAATAIAACLVLVFIAYGKNIFNGNILQEAEDNNPKSYSKNDNDAMDIALPDSPDAAFYTSDTCDEFDNLVRDELDKDDSVYSDAIGDNGKALYPSEPTTDSKPKDPSEPSASDAFSSNPETPEYIYFPTELLDKVTITEAIYDHDTTLIDTADGIYFAIYEKKVAVSQYKWIQEKYNTQFIVDSTIDEDQIVEITFGNDTQETEGGELQPVEPITPTVPLETIDYVDGLYISTIEGDSSFTIYWYENECFYRLVLPNEYHDGNEQRFTDLTLIKNHQY